MILLVLGANSDIAFAVARKFAEAEKARIYLASRDMAALRKKAADLEARFQVKAEPLFFDGLDYDSHEAFYGTLEPKPDGILLAFGNLGDQTEAQKDFSRARAIIESNFLGAVSILEVAAADFERRGHGFIIGLSSVAGERGRQSNYIYGSAKGALSVYLSGLRNRLHRRSVRVMTVLPGFVRTKMTEHMALPEPLTGEPAEIADDIYRAFLKKRDIVYTKWFWRWVMMVIKAIPECLFKRMKL